MSDHKQWVSEIFDRAAPEYGKKSSSFFNDFGKSLVGQIDIAPDSTILDVATGRGAVLFPLAQAVGPSGKVIGIDISQQMISQTSKEVRERNLDWIELKQMDAEQLDFPDNSFDYVFCGFALFFLPSIARGLSEFKRVLKPHGKLVVSTWGRESELKMWINEELKNISKLNSLLVTSLHTEKELRRALEEASFKDIQIAEETKKFLHFSAEEWWDSLWNHGTRAKFEQLSPEQIEALREKALKKACSIIEGQRVPESFQVFYGVAAKN